MPKPVSPLQYLTQDLPGFSHAAQVKMACDAGVKWVQLRVKDKSWEEWLQVAMEVSEITKHFDATLIINDSAEIAKQCGADGVHLGQTDMQWSEALKIAGEDAIIGVSAHSWDELYSLQDARIHYAGLGPFRFTETKEKLDEVLGLEGIREILQRMRQHSFQLPVIAIGGIQLTDVKELMNSGVHGIAVSGAINKSQHPQEAAASFLAALTTIISEREKMNI